MAERSDAAKQTPRTTKILKIQILTISPNFATANLTRKGNVLENRALKNSKIKFIFTQKRLAQNLTVRYWRV